MKEIQSTKVSALMAHENFKDLMPVQAALLPYAKEGRDCIVQAKTGSGKTHAFLFSLLDLIQSKEASLQGLIIAPTRELAQQIYGFAKGMLVVDPDLRIDLVIGGKDRTKTIQKMSKGQPHLVIGTPGRLKDLFLEGYLRLDQAKLCVLDEADMILEYGFMEDVFAILDRMDKKHQTMVFSATLSQALVNQIKKYLYQPKRLILDHDRGVNDQVHHILVDQKAKSYGDICLNLLKNLQMAGCIIFTNTRKEAGQVAQILRENLYNPVELHGDLTSRQRKIALNQLKQNQAQILVATDIAARGMDLPYVSHVISCGLPKELDFYAHRAGRTGRNDQKGTCYLIVNQKDRSDVLRLKNIGFSFTSQKITNHGMVTVADFFEKKKFKDKVDPDILAITKRPIKKIKPNYRKKRLEAVKKVQQKKRREFIQAKIQEQKVERAKRKQILKQNHS